MPKRSRSSFEDNQATWPYTKWINCYDEKGVSSQHNADENNVSIDICNIAYLMFLLRQHPSTKDITLTVKLLSTICDWDSSRFSGAFRNKTLSGIIKKPDSFSPDPEFEEAFKSITEDSTFRQALYDKYKDNFNKQHSDKNDGATLFGQSVKERQFTIVQAKFNKYINKLNGSHMHEVDLSTNKATTRKTPALSTNNATTEEILCSVENVAYALFLIAKHGPEHADTDKKDILRDLFGWKDKSFGQIMRHNKRLMGPLQSNDALDMVLCEASAQITDDATFREEVHKRYGGRTKINKAFDKIQERIQSAFLLQRSEETSPQANDRMTSPDRAVTTIQLPNDILVGTNNELPPLSTMCNGRFFADPTMPSVYPLPPIGPSPITNDNPGNAFRRAVPPPTASFYHGTAGKPATGTLLPSIRSLVSSLPPQEAPNPSDNKITNSSISPFNRRNQ